MEEARKEIDRFRYYRDNTIDETAKERYKPDIAILEDRYKELARQLK